MDVVSEARTTTLQGIRGVPSFTFGNDAMPAFYGAQDVATFVSHSEKHAGKAFEALYTETILLNIACPTPQ